MRGVLDWIRGEERSAAVQDPAEGRRRFWRALDPKRDPIRFTTPLKCTGIWTEPGSGCGHIVHLSYMSPRKRKKGVPAVFSAACPICGASYPFSLVKLKVDSEYLPRPDEERDLRALAADIREMAKGERPTYGPPIEERIRLHCLAYRKDGDCAGHAL